MSQLGNRVKETTDTTGTGTLDLNGAATGFRGFADEFTSGNRVRYLIVDDPDNPTEYEFGLGVFTTGTPNTLTRETVKGSSNSGSKVSFAPGTKTVIATPVDDDIAWRVSAKTADYAVTVADHRTLFTVDASAVSPPGATITLPAVADVWPGFEIEVKRTGATGDITIDGNGAETIDGAATGTLSAQYDAVRLKAGSAGWHKVAEVAAEAAVITLGTPQATTSGTAFDYTDIPAGTKEISIFFKGVSLSGSDAIIVQIGDSGGLETSGYLGGAGHAGAQANFTTAFGVINSGGAGSVHHGEMTLKLANESDNTWIARSIVALSNSATIYWGAGSKSLSGVLDRLRITRNGTDTFDAGEVNIAYK